MKPKPSRRTASLPDDERAEHARRASLVVWRKLVRFADDPQTDDPEDHGDRPYQPGNSVMDMERRGVLEVRWSPEWVGGLHFVVTDDQHAVKVMLDRGQVWRLFTGLGRWLAGAARSWDGKPMNRLPSQCHE